MLQCMRMCTHQLQSMIEQPKTLHATQAGDKFNLVLANTIHRDGTPESGKYDEVCVCFLSYGWRSTLCRP